MRSITVALLFLFPLVSHAYSYIDNRGVLPIGEIEAFMANTGVALSGSTGAVYYNPAGLASVEKNHLSISANSYIKTTGDITPLQTFDGTEMNFHVEGLQTIPTSFVSTGRLGDVRYAFSVLIPHQLKVQDSHAYSSPHYPNMQYSRTNSYSLLEAGPTIAARFSGLYDAGAGCFFTLQSTTNTSAFTAGTNSSTGAYVSTSYYDATSSGLLCNAGVQVRMTDVLRVGATLRLPFIAFTQMGTSAEFVQIPNIGSPSDGKSAADGPKDIKPDFKIPLEIAIGAEYRFAPTLAGYADLNYQVATKQNTGAPGALDNENNGTARASVGLAYNATPTIELYGGFGYNPSSVKTINSDYAENFVVGTVGSRVTTSNTNLGIGLLYAHSTGEIQSPAYDYQLQEIPGQKKTGSVTTTAFGILLSSGFLF